MSLDGQVCPSEGVLLRWTQGGNEPFASRKGSNKTAL